MSPKFTVWLATAVVIVLLSINMVICALFSYWGVGIQQVGPRHLRAGSTAGPVVTGGGPRTGK